MATIVVPKLRSPIADAEAIRKAVKGWGTDEKAIIAIIGHRNADQRKLIRKSYEDSFQEDLIRRFESELKGPFERAVYRWMLDPADRDAVLAHVALKQSNDIDYGVIIELSCIYSSEEFLSVKRAYQARYKRSIEEDVASHVPGHLGKLLVGLASKYRYDGDEINPKLAKSEAAIIHDAIKHNVFNHDEIMRIMTSRSKAQLVATFNFYKDDYNASITKHLKGETTDKYLAALKATIKSIYDAQKYYEKVLRYAINKSGKDEDTVTRVIVTRAEKDLKKISELYQMRNSISLDHSISRKFSGDYKAFLLTLLGKED